MKQQAVIIRYSIWTIAGLIVDNRLDPSIRNLVWSRLNNELNWLRGYLVNTTVSERG